MAWLVSDDGVHAHSNHMIAAAETICAAGVAVSVHVFTDGRDVPPSSAVTYVSDLSARLPSGATIATVSGRFFAMDRDNRWERVGQAVDAIMFGKGLEAATAERAIGSQCAW